MLLVGSELLLSTTDSINSVLKGASGLLFASNIDMVLCPFILGVTHSYSDWNVDAYSNTVKENYTKEAAKCK